MRSTSDKTGLKDTFGRKIDYLRLSITDRCNLRCRYCMPEEGVPPLAHGDVLSYEEMLRLASLSVSLGVRKIRVTGGEPLVRKGLVTFLTDLAALPEKPEIVLTTNGLRLSEMASELKDAGVSRVNVSLDTLKEERFEQITRRRGLDKVLAGLKAAEEAGLTPIKVNMVPIRGVNGDEIADFARLTLEHDWHVRFIEFMPVSDDLVFSDENRLPAASILEQLRLLGPLQEIEREEGINGPARLYRLAGARGKIGIIHAVSDHFCNNCNRLRLTADGRLRSCLFSNEEIALGSALRAGAGDDELKSLLLGSVETKPSGHLIGQEGFATGSRKMSGIGG